MFRVSCVTPLTDIYILQIANCKSANVRELFLPKSLYRISLVFIGFHPIKIKLYNSKVILLLEKKYKTIQTSSILLIYLK